MRNLLWAGDFWLAYLTTGVIVGLVAAGIAQKKGRDPLRWFFIGMLANVAVLVILSQLPKRFPKVLG